MDYVRSEGAFCHRSYDSAITDITKALDCKPLPKYRHNSNRYSNRYTIVGLLGEQHPVGMILP
jgi:hypothetical protein